MYEETIEQAKHMAENIKPCGMVEILSIHHQYILTLKSQFAIAVANHYNCTLNSFARS